METTDPSEFDVTSRLMKDARDSSRRTFLRQQEYAKEKQAELSFQPTISEASRDLVSNNAGKSSKYEMLKNVIVSLCTILKL